MATPKYYEVTPATVLDQLRIVNCLITFNSTDAHQKLNSNSIITLILNYYLITISLHILSLRDQAISV